MTFILSFSLVERAQSVGFFIGEEDLKAWEGIESLLKVDCKLNHQTRRTMSHSARGEAKGQSKGRNAPCLPPIPPNTSSCIPLASAPSAASGAHAPLNPVLARQQAQEKNYPLWRYVTRKEGFGVLMYL